MATAPVVDWRQILRPTRGQLVYNPNKETIERSFGGCPYRFPPGISELVALYKGHSVDHLLNHFFGDSQHAAQAGIRPLFSEDTNDPRNVAVMREADEFAEENLYRAALQLKLAHMDRTAKEKEANVPPSPPSRATMQAMEYVAEVDRKRGTASLFKCDLCNWPLERKADQGPHDLKYHPERVPEAGFIPAENEPVGDAPLRTIPSPAQQAAARAAADEAMDAAIAQAPQSETDAKFNALTDLVADLAKQVRHLAANKPKKRGRPAKVRPIVDPEDKV